jgi:hypothetical protein
MEYVPVLYWSYSKEQYWVMMPRSPVRGYQCFRRTCGLQFQGSSTYVPEKYWYPLIRINGIIMQEIIM